MRRKGVSLIITMIVVVIVVFILLALVLQVVNNARAAKRAADTARAFFAAESGGNTALAALNRGDWTGWSQAGGIYSLPLRPLTDEDGETVSFYEVTLDMSNPESPVCEAAGYAPAPDGAKKCLRVSFARTQAAITAKGDVEIKGNAQITGEVLTFADFSFLNAFQKTPDEVKSAPSTQIVADPPNNYAPVPQPAEDYTDQNGNGRYDEGEPFDDGNGNGRWDDRKDVTWFELASGEEALISQDDWSGSGVLVVEGGDLKITGGAFDGVIWVMGNLYIAGNAVIRGTIFVDGRVEDVTAISGTPNIIYDENIIKANFGGRNPLLFKKASWREIYD